MTAPVISNVSPAPGPDIGPSDFIQFDVTSSPPLALVVAMVAIDPMVAPESVHDFAAAAYEPIYALNSTRVVITNGFRYRFRRTGGWTSSPILKVIATNTSGDVTVGP